MKEYRGEIVEKVICGCYFSSILTIYKTLSKNYYIQGTGDRKHFFSDAKDFYLKHIDEIKMGNYKVFIEGFIPEPIEINETTTFSDCEQIRNEYFGFENTEMNN